MRIKGVVSACGIALINLIEAGDHKAQTAHTEIDVKLSQEADQGLRVNPVVRPLGNGVGFFPGA